MADLFFKGIPPIVGGVYDQDNWFMEAASFWRREQDALRKEPRADEHG